MTIDKIMAPIKEDIGAFEKHIDVFIAQVQHQKVKDNYKTFFKASGKYLRPSLLMLSAGAVAGDKNCFDERFYKLGFILELLHSASLVHDDIVDGDLERRGEKTVNQVFGNKIAVLAGDTLFSYAFREATVHYDKHYSVPITNLALTMCMAELEQANEVEDYDGYIRVIKGKTAEFMAVACALGARYAGGDDAMIDHMEQLGLALGMTYQMVDDLVDQDPNALKYITEADVQIAYNKTKALIEALKASDYKNSLAMLLNFIMDMKD